MLAIPALATFITMICETFMSSSLFEDSNSLVKARRTLKNALGCSFWEAEFQIYLLLFPSKNIPMQSKGLGAQASLTMLLVLNSQGMSWSHVIMLFTK